MIFVRSWRGETDELHFDFVVDSDVQVVVIYSYLKNVKKRRREIGWNVTLVYDLRSGPVAGTSCPSRRSDVPGGYLGETKRPGAA